MNTQQKSECTAVHKGIFVSTVLDKLLKAIDSNIAFVKYTQFPNKEEIVEVRYQNGYRKTVCVTADSLKAIVIDVMHEIE